MMNSQTFKPEKNFENYDNYIYPTSTYPICAIFSKSEQLVIVPTNYGNIAMFEVSDPEVIYTKEHPDTKNKGNKFCQVDWHKKTGVLAAIDNQGHLFVWSHQ